MRYGWVLPYGDARTAAELAAVAEEHGWDGFFVWEGVWGIDAWMMLTAVAMRTERIRMGTMLTPLPRRQPWDLAAQVATLDNLSGGRVILPVGLGASDDRWWIFEDDPGRRTRADMMDEGLELMQALWSGEPVAYEGAHYRARMLTSLDHRLELDMRQGTLTRHLEWQEPDGRRTSVVQRRFVSMKDEHLAGLRRHA